MHALTLDAHTRTHTHAHTCRTEDVDDGDESEEAQAAATRASWGEDVDASSSGDDGSWDHSSGNENAGGHNDNLLGFAGGTSPQRSKSSRKHEEYKVLDGAGVPSSKSIAPLAGNPNSRVFPAPQKSISVAVQGGATGTGAPSKAGCDREGVPPALRELPQNPREHDSAGEVGWDLEDSGRANRGVSLGKRLISVERATPAPQACVVAGPDDGVGPPISDFSAPGGLEKLDEAHGGVFTSSVGGTGQVDPLELQLVLRSKDGEEEGVGVKISSAPMSEHQAGQLMAELQV